MFALELCFRKNSGDELVLRVSVRNSVASKPPGQVLFQITILPPDIGVGSQIVTEYKVALELR